MNQKITRRYVVHTCLSLAALGFLAWCDWPPTAVLAQAGQAERPSAEDIVAVANRTMDVSGNSGSGATCTARVSGSTAQVSCPAHAFFAASQDSRNVTLIGMINAVRAVMMQWPSVQKLRFEVRLPGTGSDGRSRTRVVYSVNLTRKKFNTLVNGPLRTDVNDLFGMRAPRDAFDAMGGRDTSGTR